MSTPNYQGIIKPKGLEGLKGLRGWNELSQEEQSSWLESHPKAKGVSPLEMSIAFRNNNYLETLGPEVYNTYDIDTLGELYKDKVVNDAFGDYYKNDSNFQVLNSLTTDSKQELLESGYLNEEESKKQSDILYESYAKGMQEAAKFAPAAPGTGGITTWDTKDVWEKKEATRREEEIEAIIAKDNKKKVADSKEDIDALFNFYTNAQEAWVKASNMLQDVMDGKETPSSVVSYMALNGIITPEQGKTLLGRNTEQQLNLIGEILAKSDFNPSRIDTMYDNIARPQTVQGTSEFGEVEDYQMPGSRTYNALKDTNRFKNFSASDKLREYVTWQVLANKYGVTDAISNLETSMMDYANEHENFGNWITDVGLNVTLGGIANIMNKVNAVGNLITEAWYGSEALAYKLSGKNIDGTDREQHEDNGVFSIFNWFSDNWDNPYYWSKVDEYNTLDPLQIAEFDANGGISPMVTVRPPDEVVPFFSTETLKEALKMSKFVWSDYLTGRLLGGMSSAATAGATKIGGLGFGKVVNTAGAIGTVAASGMGIAESYGVMTYEQAYQQMMESLDTKRDAAAKSYVEELMQSPKSQKEINDVIAKLKKQNPDISEEEIRKSVEADFINYHTQQFHNSDDSIKARAEDEKVARKAAANAYMVDATIEELRMALANFTFRKYLFDKGTRAALGDNTNYSKVATGADGLLQDSPVLNKVWSTIKPVWGGFTSNYFDDVTVGFGKGFGLEQYNSYLQSKYDATKAVASSDYTLSFLEGLGGGYSGAMEALGDRQSFYDGFVGALGAPISVMPRLSRAERSDALRKMNREDANNLTAGEWINKWFMNPLLEAYYEEMGKQARTAEKLPIVNKEVADHKDALENINQLIIGLNSVADADISGSHIQRADAKANQAFELLYTMNGLRSAPLIAEHPLIEHAAEEIDRLASGKITDAEITAFLSQPGNKTFGQGEEARAAAAERIKKNAKSLQEMNKKISKVRQSLEDSVLGKDINSGLKEQMVYQLVMDEAWQERLTSIENTLSGKPDAASGQRSSNLLNRGHNAVAAYGSSAEFERQWNAHQEVVRDLDKQIENQKRSLAAATKAYQDILKDPKATSEEITALKNLALMFNLQLQSVLEARREADAKAKELKRDASVFKDGEVPVLSAEQILSLNPVDRNTILDKKNRNNYSAEQQVAIDEALTILKTRTPDAEQLLSDAATLSTRIKDNKKAYRRIQENPDAASAYYTTIVTGREEQLKKVFAQRRLEDAYRKFDSATTDEELLSIAKQSLNSKELGMKSKHLDSYIKRNPKKSNILSGLRDVAKIREDAYEAVKTVVSNPTVRAILVQQVVEATNDANNSTEAMAALESLMDIQTDAVAKRQYDMILENMKSLGHQRDATKIRDRKLERQRKQEAEVKRLEEEAKKDGKNYHWEGFKVGDTVYNKKTGGKATVVGFEKEDIIVLEFKYKDGTTGRDRFSAEKYRNSLTKEEPSPENNRRGDKQIKKSLRDLSAATTLEEKASAIAFYDTNKYRGAETTAEEDTQVQKAKDELKAAGIEYIDMLGKPYHDGMIVTANFVEDDTLEPGKQIITAVRRPQLNKDGKMIQSAKITVSQNSNLTPKGAVQPTKDSPISNPSGAELTQIEDVNLSVDSDGKINSPSAEHQAAAEESKVISVPTVDVSEQGNKIVEDTNYTISGNRYVIYSIDGLKGGKVEIEVPENPNSIFGKYKEWITNNNIKIQEIIDEEFGRILEDNPDIKIRFMKFNPRKSDIGYKLQNNFINVIELTPELRNKYHKEERGGVIQVDGKSWLVVGITGFENGNIAQRKAYDTMKAPINKRRDAYFANNKDADYYVDPVAYSQVQNTTSGRIVNQRLGQEAPTLKKVSELLKSAGMSLKQAMFGIQTGEAGQKSFATTKNVKSNIKVFPPRNVEDNRGRTFILIDTANGNKIPGMIEPAMYRDLAEDSPLKEMINSTIAQLFSTSYETRLEAIKQLCGLLVLNDSKNILIGKKDANVLTIRRQGMPDIVQKLGNEFDSVQFFKDLENANFQINIPLESLNDPTMLKVYDDSGALMTTVDSMRTAGMSYSIYMTDASGKPIMITPAGNAVPGTGKSEFRKYTSVRVENTTYRLENGQWVNNNTGTKVNPGTALERSCYYNRDIQEGNWRPFNAEKGKEYYDVITRDGKHIVVTRDSFGNIEELGVEESSAIFAEVQRKVENQIRAKNLEDVDLGEDTSVVSPMEMSLEDITLEQINQQAVGNFEAPPVSSTKTQQQPITQKQLDEYLDEFRPIQDKSLDKVGYETSVRIRGEIKNGKYYKIHEYDLKKSTEELLSEIEQMREALKKDRKFLEQRRKESAGEKSSEALRGPLALIELHTKRAIAALEVLYQRLNESAAATTEEVVKEVKESQPQQSKEVIMDLGKKSLSELQNTKNLTTFDAIAKSTKYGDELYKVLESKGWGITGDFASDAEILKQHNITITGVSNVEDWINFIRDCR